MGSITCLVVRLHALRPALSQGAGESDSHSIDSGWHVRLVERMVGAPFIDGGIDSHL